VSALSASGARYRRALRRRGVSPVIATILLLAITIVLVVVLYELIALPLAPSPPSVQLLSNYNSTNIVVYGEGNSPVSLNCPGPSGTCVVPGETFTIQGLTRSVPVSLVQVEFLCDGSVANSGSLTSISNPSTAPSVGAGHASSSLCPNQPTGGPSCINYPAWVDAAFVNLVYYLPRTTGQTTLQAGDQFVVYGSVCQTRIGSAGGGFYYGPPPECVSGLVACSIQLIYTGQSGGVLANLQLYP
jgi:flagellin-like protein